jgi:methionyl-tRNA formyltransferase
VRLVVFADPAMASSMSLLAGALEAGASSGGRIEIVAVVDTARAPAPRLRLPRMLASTALRRLCNLNTAAEPEDPALASCRRLARRHRVPVLAPGGAGVNDPGFVEAVRQLRPDAAIALMVAQIFREPLLAACGTPVNYHNGLLPRYQGVAATGWSIYEGATESGFSFHLMSQEVDQGPILLQGAVPLGPSSAAAPVERAKTALARGKLGELFALLRTPAPRAVAQEEPGSSFSRADLGAIRTVQQPSQLSFAELELRLRAFEIIDLTLAGRRWRVTALRRVGRRAHSPRLAFTTADGVRVEPSRVWHVPPGAYRVLQPLLGSS